MKTQKFLIDGKYYTPEECKKLFENSIFDGRQKICLDLISDKAHTIVDLGCLYGTFTDALVKKYPNKEIKGGDYLEENLEIARFLYPHIKNLFSILNVYSLPFKDKTIDCIVFQEVIEHLEGAAQGIKEINRTLKLGGELILSTPTPYYWRDMLQCFKYELVKRYFKKDLPLSDAIYFQEHEWNRHVYCWSPSTLYTLLKINGFEYVTHTYDQSGKGWFERLMLKMLPFLSSTIIIKVKKVSDASMKIV